MILRTGTASFEERFPTLYRCNMLFHSRAGVGDRRGAEMTYIPESWQSLTDFELVLRSSILLGAIFVLSVCLIRVWKILGEAEKFRDLTEAIDYAVDQVKTPKRPWRKHLEDPVKRDAALRRYKKRLKNVRRWYGNSSSWPAVHEKPASAIRPANRGSCPYHAPQHRRGDPAPDLR